jgi:hypothetical protein
MRCPKCGFISFDNVESCLKCNKDISETSAAFQGTTFNHAVPAFLKFSEPEDDTEASIDESDDSDSDIEFADPDLEILIDDGEDGEINFSMDEDEDDDSEADDAALTEEFGALDSPDEAEDPDDSDATLDLGMFEDGSEEDSFGFEESDEPDSSGEVNLDLPEELNDISDLSPPDTISDDEMLSFDEEQPDSSGKMELPEEKSPPADLAPSEEMEEKLDFGSLDMDLPFDDDEPEENDIPEPDVTPAAPKKAPAGGGAGMDDELDMNLDLGGLSIHDDR